MTDFLTSPIFVLAVTLLFLLVCWPIAQSLRHPDHRPFAAYLVFTASLVLVSAVVFWGALLAGMALLPAGALESRVAAAVIVLIAALAGFGAAAWLVRRPPKQRMPR